MPTSTNAIEDHNADPLGHGLVDQVHGFWRAKNIVWVQLEEEGLVTLTESPRAPGLPPLFTNPSLPILARSTHWKLWIAIMSSGSGDVGSPQLGQRSYSSCHALPLRSKGVALRQC
ncbi:hypothetical protein FCV25MIE_14060 [Fagus crenata]